MKEKFLYEKKRDQDYSITGEKKVLRVSHENFDEIKMCLREFLIEEIESYIKNAGGKQALSLKLGKEEAYVHLKYKRALRGSFSGLEKLYRECRGKIDGIKHESGDEQE